MKFFIRIIFAIIIIINMLSPDKAISDKNTDVHDGNITVDGKSFSVDEINSGIKNTFMNSLYYYDYIHSSLDADSILKHKINYELYYEPIQNESDKYPASFPLIHLIITGLQHPLSTEETPQLYDFSIILTEWGLQSYFYSEGHIPQENALDDYNNNYIYLGSYNMLIDEIIRPEYESMNDEWKQNIKAAIKLYMDNNYKEMNLAPGNYHVYVQGFFRGDTNGAIIFENENGSVYTGTYYFIHEASGSYPADLSNVELYVPINNARDEEFRAYLKKLHDDNAVMLEYTVQ